MRCIAAVSHELLHLAHLLGQARKVHLLGQVQFQEVEVQVRAEVHLLGQVQLQEVEVQVRAEVEVQRGDGRTNGDCRT